MTDQNLPQGGMGSNNPSQPVQQQSQQKSQQQPQQQSSSPGGMLKNIISKFNKPTDSSTNDDVESNPQSQLQQQPQPQPQQNVNPAVKQSFQQDVSQKTDTGIQKPSQEIDQPNQSIPQIQDMNPAPAVSLSLNDPATVVQPIQNSPAVDVPKPSVSQPNQSVSQTTQDSKSKIQDFPTLNTDVVEDVTTQESVTSDQNVGVTGAQTSNFEDPSSKNQDPKLGNVIPTEGGLSNAGQGIQNQVGGEQSQSTQVQPQTQPSTQTTQTTQTDNSSEDDVLAKFAKEDFSKIARTIKFVKDGPKLDNAAMQELLYRLKTKQGMSYRELLSVYITMDMAVEKGVLTNDVLDYLKQNPEALEKFKGEEKEEGDIKS